MTDISFIDCEGMERPVLNTPPGLNLMEIAVSQEIPGIIGRCGGFATCGTCHVYLTDSAGGDFAPPTETEIDVLAGVSADVTAQSRLACQLTIDERHSSIVVTTPDIQG